MKFVYIMLAAAMAATSCAGTDNRAIEVVPYPNEVSVKSGYFEVSGADFHCGEGLDAVTSDAIKAFAGKLGAVTGKESAVKIGDSRDGFIFLKDASLPDEAYELRISKKAVEVKASSFNGFNYALQTIKQMLPAEIFGNAEASDKDWTLQCAVIKDAPRFAYRGMMLDVARHFFSIEEVKRYLDVLEVHKMNRFHWHLTDDQGWRIEIKRYPRLTEVGSIRKGTVVKKNWDQYDGIPYGGFYTQDEIREVIRYAESKGITVVPEIDLPGHMLAALTAYPELGCTGGPYDVWGRWGVADDVLCHRHFTRCIL